MATQLRNHHADLEHADLTSDNLPGEEQDTREGPNRTQVSLVIFVLTLCVLPFVLMQIGVSLAAPSTTGLSDTILEAGPALSMSLLFELMQGGMIHALVEWTVMCVAILTALLAFAHFRIRQDSISPIISMAAFWAGVTSGANVLSVSGLAVAVADLPASIPFRNMVSHNFTALILVAAALLVFARHNVDTWPFKTVTVVMMNVFFGIVAVTLIVWTAGEPTLPQTIYPDATIKRPWNLPALALYLTGATAVFAILHKRHATHFSFALWLSSLPFLAGQIYYIFGSRALFDGHFNAAQGLTLVGFLVIFGGLLWDYSWTCQEEAHLRRALQVRDNRIRTLVDNAGEGVFLFDAAGRIQMWNGQAAAILGWREDQIVGEGIFELLLPESLKNNHRAWIDDYILAQTNEPIPPRQETVLLHKDGHEVPVEYSLVPTEDNGHSFFIALIRDVTEQRQMQLRMIQMDRMVAVGTLAAGVGHEVNNPLSYVVSNIYFAREQVEEAAEHVVQGLDEVALSTLEEVCDVLDAAREGADRVATIVEDLGVFSRIQDDKLAPLNIVTAIDVALRMTHNEIKRCARLETHFEPVPAVLANEPRLSQVFVNLLLNAVQAMPAGAPDENTIGVRVFVDDACVVVEVRDTGPGIPADVLPRIFDPFFTTKPVGQGTGLGLSLSHTIVRELGGHLSVQTEVGEGSVFRVELPVAGE